MSFDALLGNDQLKQNLSRSIARGHISHFYLISGPKGSGKHTLAQLLAAAILCQGESRPCLGCKPCRKVMSGSHPDYITVDDPEKAFVPVNLIRETRADMYIRPNEAEHKIYLFPRAQDMRPEAQNALLKILEEPPAYGVFILLTDNPFKLLPTVRSRCTELKLRTLEAPVLTARLRRDFPQASGEDIAAAVSRSGGYLGQAAELLAAGNAVPEQTVRFVDAFCRRDALALMYVLVPMEKWKRDALIPMLQSWQILMEEALLCRSGVPTGTALSRKLAEQCSGTQLLDAEQKLKKVAEYAAGNVAPAAICDYLEWALR